MELTLKASEVDRLIESEEGIFAGWLKRLNKNGIGDVEATAALTASSVRYQQLGSLRRGYLTDYSART